MRVADSQARRPQWNSEQDEGYLCVVAQSDTRMPLRSSLVLMSCGLSLIPLVKSAEVVRLGVSVSATTSIFGSSDTRDEVLCKAVQPASGDDEGSGDAFVKTDGTGDGTDSIGDKAVSADSVRDWRTESWRLLSGQDKVDAELGGRLRSDLDAATVASLPNAVFVRLISGSFCSPDVLRLKFEATFSSL
eukprot:TRINITY_DN16814_c0_g1_i6.p2 TRINITY_DN16814_c0_g1~~TRINITY_DN16814_c0_g1_i6.p2  ORF type:complete len:189 (+),score=21.61 TRINITY_DN16814_c0_g1_i6:102-668(+)